VGQKSVPFLIHIEATRKERDYADSTVSAWDTNPPDHLDHAATPLTDLQANKTVTLSIAHWRPIK
jgi:hypothetical protein